MSRVRSMNEGDLPMVLKWRNHPEIRRLMVTQHEIAEVEHRAWFARASTDQTKVLLIAEADGIPIGFVQFDGVAADTAAEWGFYAAPEAPKGSGRRLANSALQYAFVSLRLHKVCGRALDFNSSSIRFHDQLGFRREGVLREQYRIADSYHDVICFGLLRAEWKLSSPLELIDATPPH